MLLYMRRFVKWVTLGGLGLLLLACGSVVTEPVEEGSLSVLTYNVAGLPAELSSSDPVANHPQISSRLNSYDLVLVQEDFAYHDLLASDARHPNQSLPKEAVRGMNDGLNRFSQSPFGPLLRETWTACNGIIDDSSDCLADKGFSMAVHNLAQGVDLHVYNLHMDAGREEADFEARSQQVQQLLDALALHSPNAALLVVGDQNMKLTNTPVDDPSLYARLIEEGGLSDACTEVGCGDPRYDRIMMRSSEKLLLTVQSWSLPEEFVDAAGKDLSDHEPVHVGLDWISRR